MKNLMDGPVYRRMRFESAPNYDLSFTNGNRACGVYKEMYGVEEEEFWHVDYYRSMMIDNIFCDMGSECFHTYDEAKAAVEKWLNP